MGAQSILQIILRVTKEGQGAREAAREAKELKGTLGELGLGSLASVTALGALTGAVTAVAAYTKQAVDSTVKYAMEVKNLKNITGESAEETSRVIQVMDDFEIKTADLTTAQKKLAEQGLTLNIDTLAKLSDEYLKLGSGAERTQFLLDNFGKSGMKMASAMMAGGEALRGMSDATLDSLVLSEQAIKDAEEYRLAVDALSDAWEGYKIEVGTKVIPELTRLLSDYTENHEKWFKAQGETLSGSVAMTREYAEEMRRTNYQIKVGAAMTEAWNKQLASQGQYFDVATGKVLNYADGVDESAEALKALSDANREFYKGVETMQSLEDSYAEKVRTNAEERKKIEKEKAEYIAQYGTWNVEALAKFDDALAENSQQAQQNASEQEKATNRVILSYMERKLMADGILDDKETEWLLKKGVEWGIYSETAIQSFRDVMAEGNEYINMLNGIPSEIVTVAQFHVQESGGGSGSGGTVLAYATGTDGWETVPAGYPNDSYPIFLTSGEKFAVIPAGGGAETFSGFGGGGLGGDQVVTVRLAGEAERLFTPMVERIVRRMR